MRKILLVLCVFVALPSGVCAQTKVKDIARISTYGDSMLQGYGLVTGLAGTGDSGKELAVARPLAEILRKNGALITVDDLQNSKSTALVLIRCEIPESGARTSDRFDVSISVINSASSLEGGELYIAPLTAPIPNGDVYGFATGRVTIENEDIPTVGVVHRGARMVRDILMEPVGNTFDLLLSPHVAGFSATTYIASQINQEYYSSPDATLPPIAVAIDDRMVRVDIPPAEQANRTAFISDVMSFDIERSLLKLPATVICNERAGSIVITGDVQISPSVLQIGDLSITTTIPAPVPTADAPLQTQANWAGVSTKESPADTTKLEDLLDALRQLNITPKEQIEVLRQLHKAGQLHARLIFE